MFEEDLVFVFWLGGGGGGGGTLRFLGGDKNLRVQ